MIDSEVANKVKKWFYEHEEEMLKVLEDVVNLESFTYNGKDVNALGDYICTWLEREGFTSYKAPQEKPFIYDESMDWLEKLGNVRIARSHPIEKGAGLVFIGHMDTVFPKDAFTPFQINKEEDKAYGSGIIDMKGGLVINMFTAKALRELNLVDCPITLTFSPDEEIGSPTTMPVLQKNLIDAKAVICTEPGYLNGGVSIERKGSGHMRLCVQGISAHAGRNYADGASAILELSHKILAINEFVDLEKDKTVNTGLISGGTSANSIAPHAEAFIHITYKTLKDGEELVRNIREVTERTYIKGTTAKLTGGIGIPPLEPTENNQILLEFTKDAGKIIGHTIINQPSKGVAETGFCSTILGIPSICSMGPEGDFIHSKQEYMKVSSFVPRAAIVALTAIQAARKC